MEEKIELEGGMILLWRDENYEEKVTKGGRTRRVVEREEVRQKLQAEGILSEVFYEESGAPCIENQRYKYISISHFRGWYAVLLSAGVGGIDIQPYKNTLMAGRDYFVNLLERDLDYTDSELYLVWAAKEAFYKYKRGMISDLKNEVTVIRIDESKNEVIVAFEGKEKRLKYRQNDEYVLVYVVQE